MAWATTHVFTVGEILTAANMNLIQANMNETAPAKVTTAGDWITGSGLNAVQRTGKGTTGSAIYQGASGPSFLAPVASKAIRFNAAANALETFDVPSPAIPARDWGSAVGTVYHANFQDINLWNSSATPQSSMLGLFGWTISSMFGTTAGSGNYAGDVNDKADEDGVDMRSTGASGGGFACSPHIIGGYANIQAQTLALGSTPTTVTIYMLTKNVQNVDANQDGFGITGAKTSTGAFVANATSLGIVSGATNWMYRLEGAAAVSLGVAKDTDWHLWKFVITLSSRQVAISMDGGATLATVTFSQDLWPKALFSSDDVQASNQIRNKFWRVEIS